MDEQRGELLQGTLELLVLKTLSLEPAHGWGIGMRIQQISRDVFQVNQGSLYPALQRMVTKGWLESEWRVSENGRRARYYEITAAGRRCQDQGNSRPKSPAVPPRLPRRTFAS